VATWEGNLLAGGDRLYVVEADEYDRSFLALTPTVAVVTNIEADHLDIYADLADIKGAFALFVRGARNIVLCADDVGANSLPTPSATEVVRYGFDNADARLVARGLESRNGGSAFDVVFDDEMLGRVSLAVPGRHNVLNALAAIGSGLALGADFAAMARGLASFAGAERRFQRLGEIGGVCVVDDYAHHPTEIAATLSAARAAYPERRIIAAFQPHLYSRTRDFAREFGATHLVNAKKENPVDVARNLTAPTFYATSYHLNFVEVPNDLVVSHRKGEPTMVTLVRDRETIHLTALK